MDKWEYCLEIGRWKNRSLYINELDFKFRLAELGDAGWELVSVVPDYTEGSAMYQNTTALTFWFKRKK